MVWKNCCNNYKFTCGIAWSVASSKQGWPHSIILIFIKKFVIIFIENKRKGIKNYEMVK